MRKGMEVMSLLYLRGAETDRQTDSGRGQQGSGQTAGRSRRLLRSYFSMSV